MSCKIKDTAKATAVDLLRVNTLRVTKSTFVTPKRYAGVLRRVPRVKISVQSCCQGGRWSINPSLFIQRSDHCFGSHSVHN